MSSPAPKTVAVEKDWGLMAQFNTSGDTLKAAEKLRDKGFKKFEVYAPFPIHGMDDAMGLKATPLPWIILICGITGFCTAAFLQFGTSMGIPDFLGSGKDFGYPMIIGGKPNDIGSLTAFIPVLFELTVLFSAFGAVFGMFAVNGLPTFYRPEFKHGPFDKVNDDKFFISVSVEDANYNGSTVKYLEEIGGEDVTLIRD